MMGFHRFSKIWRHWGTQAGENLYQISFHLWLYSFGRRARLSQPIFLIGCPRSGTTLAVELFARHPDIVNCSEAQNLWDPNHLDPHGDHHWTREQVTAAAIRRLHAGFEFYRRLHCAPRLINKNPRNSVRLEYIRAIFPDAYFLHVIRDGRAVAHSIAEETLRNPQRQQYPMGNFCKPPNWRELLRDDPFEQAALQWREILRVILDQRIALGDRYHEFRYEDLCRRPQQVLAEAYAFAGLRTDEAILARIPERLTPQNFKWQAALTREQIKAITQIQAPLLGLFGYPV